MLELLKNLREKSINLIIALEAMQNVNEKSKLKVLKELNKAIDNTKWVDEATMPDLGTLLKGQMDLSNQYTTAFNFHQKGGVIDFESESLSTPKGQLISLFKKHKKSFSDEEYWENLRDTYIIQDYNQIDYVELKKLFSSNRKFRENLMTVEEQNYLCNLPDLIRIYRGGGEKELENGFGISWTLNKDIAQKFASIKRNLSLDKMVVHELKINKDKVVAFINSRDEEEIIYLGD
jgi:hypothetical protein